MDSSADQWAALQRAIDDASAKNRPLILPRGVYPISKTLELKANTQIVGAQSSTVLVAIADPNIAPDGDFLDSMNPQPMIRTVDDPNATIKLGFMRIYAGYPSAYSLLWQAGAHSTIRNARSMRPRAEDGREDNPLAIFRGNGGGRFYVAGLSSSLIDGTTQPLRFYHYQVQPDGAEFRHASNIEVYGMKYEGVKPVITMTGCRNVRVLGEGGGGHPPSVYLVNDSADYLIACIFPQFGSIPLGERDFVLEDGKGTGDANQIILYKRGKPAP
ncbi:MAG: Pectate lyase superfamily protein [candidate division BRC1 bacterium ADurb.BinA364]|nr:MAG: Pectate lyase superfamily protein [candidate division BRC1 bacterium ADurb.BinA364]